MGLQVLLSVFLGGGLGALLRYGVSQFFWWALPHPWQVCGTLVVNLIGCYLIGVVFMVYTAEVNPYIYGFLVAGLLGGLTTFSTFSLDIVMLARTGHPTFAVAYLLANVLGGLALTLWAARGAFMK